MADDEKGRFLLGIDIGATKAALALGRGAQVLDQARVEGWASGSFETDLENLVRHVRALLEQAGVSLAQIAFTGVSAAGPLDLRHGVILDAPNLRGWQSAPIVARLAQELGTPVALENDANAAAIAEHRFGAGHGAASMVFVTMSTGVGGGLVLDGRIYRGAHFAAGEIGHVPIVQGGRACACGLRGCLEAYTGGAALAKRIREDLARGEPSAIRELVGSDLAKVTAEVWARALRAGDAYARRVREEFLQALAQGLAIVITALDPDAIVLGTIIERNPDLFLDELRARTRALTWPALHGVRIEPSALGARLPCYAGLCVAALGCEESGTAVS
jgi:glucokinase